MKTPVEKMIEVVEKGYYSNETLWKEWKETLLEEERELLQHNVSVLLRDEASCLTCLYGNKDTNSYPCINCVDKNLWRKQ